MSLFAYTVPLLFIIIFIVAIFKRVKVYDSFVDGVKGTLPLIFNLFPFIATVMIMSEIFEASGLSNFLTKIISPFFKFLGVPKEIVKLSLIKPFSGSGSTALLSEIFSKYGADSYIARCASVAYGSSETVFYVSAVYFSAVKNKKISKLIFIALFANFVALVIGCLFCRIL